MAAFPDALNDSIEGIAGAGNQGAISRIARVGRVSESGWRVGCQVGARIKVEGLLVALAVGPKKAETQSKIQGEAFRYAPVVLEVGFDDFVAIVVLRRSAGLLVFVNITQQEVSERVAGADGLARLKSQDALNVGGVALVLLGKGKRSDKLGTMLA